jgi:hypothetical protein
MTEVTTLRDKTRALLNNRPRTLTLAAIAKDTNLHIAWIRDFGRGVSENPGVVSVETLYVYLTAKQAE